MQTAHNVAGELVRAEHADPAETYINPTCGHRMRLVPVGANGRKAHFQHYRGELRPTCHRTIDDLLTAAPAATGRRSGPEAWYLLLRERLSRWWHRLHPRDHDRRSGV